MKSINEIAIETAQKLEFLNDSGTGMYESEVTTLCASFLESYLAQQEPVVTIKDGLAEWHCSTRAFKDGHLFFTPPLPKVDSELANAFVLLWKSDDRAAWDKKAVEHFDSLVEKVESQDYTEPPTAIPEGWALVPKEPTQEMALAGLDTFIRTSEHEVDINVDVIYKAMVAAGEKK